MAERELAHSLAEMVMATPPTAARGTCRLPSRSDFRVTPLTG